jgi:hypothetical protein
VQLPSSLINLKKAIKTHDKTPPVPLANGGVSNWLLHLHQPGDPSCAISPFV